MKQIRKRYDACGAMLAAAKFGTIPAVMLAVTCGRGLPAGLASAIGNMLAYVPLAVGLTIYAARHGAREIAPAGPRIPDVLWGLALALPLSLSASLFAMVGDAVFGSTGTPEGVVSLVRDSGPLVPFASLALVPAACEELLIRGALYSTARKRSAGWALLVSSLAFAGMHGSPPAFFYTLYCGLVLGLVREYTGSVWCGMCVHFGFNSLTVLSAMSMARDAGNAAQAASGLNAAVIGAYLLGLAGCAAILYIMGRTRGKASAEPPDRSSPAGTAAFYALAAAAVFGPRLLGIG